MNTKIFLNNEEINYLKEKNLSDIEIREINFIIGLIEEAQILLRMHNKYINSCLTKRQKTL